MMNVDHEDWRLPSEVDLTKDLSTCARPGLQDSLSQYSQHIHPTNHSPTTHWLTFKAEIAVSEWVYPVPVLQWNVNMSIRSQSPDTLVLSSRYDAEAEYYFHQKISCCCVAILDDNLDGDILVQWRQKTAATPSLINRVVQTRGIQTGYNKDQVASFRRSMFCTVSCSSSLTTEKTLHCFDVFRLWKVIWYFRKK